jgi:ABC-type multidrug transport system permease subunit
VSSNVIKVNLKLDNARTTINSTDASIKSVQASLTDLKNNLDTMKDSMEKVNSQINALTVTSAENIVNPIKTTVTPITTKANNLNFIFPYLIILIIAFVSIMLSSTIIIMEKTSKAYFRNFTTPTKDFTFIISVFLTSLFVVILQLILILILAYYFLNTTILTNVWMTLLTIFFAITLFTLIGMIIGYLFNSQEAVTMASISVGSVFLFLSNLILPLESMSDFIQRIARFNPYVVASELLKKITLFSTSWKEVSTEFLLLLIYIIIAFALVVFIEKVSKIQYISKRPLTKALAKNEIIDKYFKLKSGVLLRDEKELLLELKKMSDITFQEYVNEKRNDFESWLIMNKSNELAKLVGKARTRKEMIDMLEKYNSQIVDPLKSKK